MFFLYVFIYIYISYIYVSKLRSRQEMANSIEKWFKGQNLVQGMYSLAIWTHIIDDYSLKSLRVFWKSVLKINFKTKSNLKTFISSFKYVRRLNSEQKYKCHLFYNKTFKYKLWFYIGTGNGGSQYYFLL